jgi:KUP system potassium uptake protein
VNENKKKQGINRLTLAGLIITLGIVYGDIGTSPLYVVKAIFTGFADFKEEFVLGAISCIFWTLTIQTSVKYVIITLQADNNGEGGIFALFALIRKKSAWAFLFAVIGGSALLADGVITPAITITSAVEGLRLLNSNIVVVPIVVIIISLLFFIQQYGGRMIGRSLGPVMLLWFLMIGALGLIQVIQHPAILKAIHPKYAIDLVTEYPKGFLLLGAVFLATTGVEALYSDLGYVGAKNIRVSWFFVKVTLILSYMGQGVWVLNHPAEAYAGVNPFFAIMPAWFTVTGIVLATAAAVTASQAVISGSFTLISEAISLNFWPKFKLRYPSDRKGQIFIPRINFILWIACIVVVILFQESSRMQAAYGLSINITMLMTTILLSLYIYNNKVSLPFLIWFLLVFVVFEGVFLYANIHKFKTGASFSILLASIYAAIMYVWYNGRRIKNKFLAFVEIEKYVPMLRKISADQSIPKHSTNLVYVTKANNLHEIESKIIYSIVNKQPKRADIYWFLHVDITDEPDTFEYRVVHYDPGKIIKVEFKLGFKVEPRINLYFKQVVEDLVESGELDMLSRYKSLREFNVTSDFQYILIDRISGSEADFTPHDQIVLDLYELIRKIAIPEARSLGLDTSNCVVEKVPLLVDSHYKGKIKRKNV